MSAISPTGAIPQDTVTFFARIAGWLEPLEPVEIDGAVLLLSAPEHVKAWVQRRYGAELKAALEHSARYFGPVRRGVNIADLEIAHSSEGDRGVLILVVDRERAEQFREALGERGYRPTITYLR